MHIEEPAEDRLQTHHFEIGTADNPGANFAGIAEANDGEADGREVAKLAQRFDPRAQILNFGYREVRVLDADARDLSATARSCRNNSSFSIIVRSPCN